MAETLLMTAVVGSRGVGPGNFGGYDLQTLADTEERPS